MLRRLLGIVLACAAVAIPAGCGGDSGGEDLTEGLTPAEILSRSADEARDLEAFRIALDATGRIDAQGAAAPGAALLRGPLDLEGEGPVVPPDRASIDATIRIGRLPLQVNVTRVADEVFVGALGQDYRVPLPPEQVALLDLGDLYPTLAGWTTSPAEAGREDVGGDPTVMIRGEIDARRAVADLASVLGLDDVSPADARAAVREGTVEAWVGTEDLLPRRVRLLLDADGSRLSPDLGAVEIDLTAELSAFGEAADISAPADAQELDLDELGSLIGG
jgi:hypothetical protein